MTKKALSNKLVDLTMNVWKIERKNESENIFNMYNIFIRKWLITAAEKEIKIYIKIIYENWKVSNSDVWLYVDTQLYEHLHNLYKKWQWIVLFKKSCPIFKGTMYTFLLE